MEKKTILSGIQPTGVFTLGNYFGAIRNWNNLQDEYNCAYCIANMHAITVRQEAAQLKKQTLNSLALLLACGIDPQKSILFIQSQVHQHAELSWVLSSFTQFGELSRMTQFKDKSLSHADNVNAALFTYPVLMAADILLYQADLVPVGADQKQHLELARDVAERFNSACGKTFTIPDGYIPKLGAKLMSLSDPTKKMSKSDDNINGFVNILESPETIVKKFKRAVTDSDMQVRYAEGKDGVNNLMSIYSLVTGSSYAAIETEFDGKGYGYFKEQVGNAVAELLAPIRSDFERFSADQAYLLECAAKGAESAAKIASRTLDKVYKKVGFVNN